MKIKGWLVHDRCDGRYPWLTYDPLGSYIWKQDLSSFHAFPTEAKARAAMELWVRRMEEESSGDQFMVVRVEDVRVALALGAKL